MAENYYLDDRALVIDGTLIRLQCEGESVTVPSTFGGCAALAVGGGALTLTGVTDLSFAPGYTHLKDRCLGYSTTLQRIHVPETVQSISEALFVRKYYAVSLQLYIDRALPLSLYQDLRRLSLPIEGKKRLLPPALFKRAELEPVRCLMLQSAYPPAVIRGDMRILFAGQLDDTKSGIYTGTVFDKRPCFDFVSGKAATEEYTAVMDMIRTDECGFHDPEAEETCDRIIRMGKPAVTPGSCAQVAVALCDRFPGAPGPDGLFHLQIRMFRRHLFFPALRRIRHRDADWWLYSRCFLTIDAHCPYLREDVGVFTRDGLVTDRNISEDVYAKYRLLTIL